MTEKSNAKGVSSVKDISSESEATLYEMYDYLCSKINFGKSFLDAVAIRAMNNLFTVLCKDKKKYPIDRMV